MTRNTIISAPDRMSAYSWRYFHVNECGLVVVEDVMRLAGEFLAISHLSLMTGSAR